MFPSGSFPTERRLYFSLAVESGGICSLWNPSVAFEASPRLVLKKVRVENLIILMKKSPKLFWCLYA